MRCSVAGSWFKSSPFGKWEYDNVFNGSYTYQHNCYMSGGSWVHRSHWWNNVLHRPNG